VDPYGLKTKESWWDRLRRNNMEKQGEKIMKSKWRWQTPCKKKAALNKLYSKYKDLKGAASYCKGLYDQVENPTFDGMIIMALDTLEYVPTHSGISTGIKEELHIKEIYERAEGED
jgi:hypothetical protein